VKSQQLKPCCGVTSNKKKASTNGNYEIVGNLIKFDYLADFEAV
jgi:hypothetical protein